MITLNRDLEVAALAVPKVGSSHRSTVPSGARVLGLGRHFLNDGPSLFFAVRPAEEQAAQEPVVLSVRMPGERLTVGDGELEFGGVLETGGLVYVYWPERRPTLRIAPPASPPPARGERPPENFVTGSGEPAQGGKFRSVRRSFWPIRFTDGLTEEEFEVHRDGSYKASMNTGLAGGSREGRIPTEFAGELHRLTQRCDGLTSALSRQDEQLESARRETVRLRAELQEAKIDPATVETIPVGLQPFRDQDFEILGRATREEIEVYAFGLRRLRHGFISRIIDVPLTARGWTEDVRLLHRYSRAFLREIERRIARLAARIIAREAEPMGGGGRP